MLDVTSPQVRESSRRGRKSNSARPAPEALRGSRQTSRRLWPFSANLTWEFIVVRRMSTSVRTYCIWQISDRW